MTPDPAPVPNEIPDAGVNLQVNGVDTNGLSSVSGLTNPTLNIDDPDAVFAFTVDPSQESATLIPNPGVAGSATVTFAAGTTLDDGTPGPDVSAVYLGAKTPGNAVTVDLVATDIVPPAPA